MTLEAARQLGKPQGSMVKFLKGHLDEIRTLTFGNWLAPSVALSD